MNSRERKMLELLKRLKGDFGACSVKAEFEAEGTRTDELLRLIEIARKADMGIALKIGGCEAVRDLIESKQIGVEYIIAPMVETEYALTKFIEAKNKIYSQDEQSDTEFLVNIETITGYKNLKGISKIAASDRGINGLVFGRVDFAGSLGMHRDDINSDEILKYSLIASKECELSGLDFVIGGGVSSLSLPFLKEIDLNYLTRFETRKVIFESDSLNSPKISDALLDAVHLELLWLLNKRDYYTMITLEDNKRIDMLENRWNILKNQVGS